MCVCLFTCSTHAGKASKPTYLASQTSFLPQHIGEKIRPLLPLQGILHYVLYMAHFPARHKAHVIT